LRFLEWRFLGAPAAGPGKRSDEWWLTKRDRFAHPIGQTLLAKPISLDVPDLLLTPPPTLGVTAPCAPPAPGKTPSTTTTTVPTKTPAEPEPFARDPLFDEERARDHPEATHRPWEPTTPSS
jgi:hypothetical protein